jgi:hypothetical protein
MHRTVWLNGSAPLLYVGWPTRVDILSCARGADFWQEKQNTYKYDPAETIPVEADVSHILKTSASISQALSNRFSATRLSNGTFWDDPSNFDLANSDRSAYRCLTEAVVEADEALEGEKHPLLRRLLLLTVLVKYLEDRGVFPDGWFGQFHLGAESFFDLLQKGTPHELRELLKTLELKFNGDVFCLPERGARALTSEQLRTFATLVESKTLHQQRYLWEPFSFRHVPVEVLSHIYQHFAQRGKGAIYTPPFVASLLLDFALPYNKMAGNERILDPTCGSGVFLVGAFRRLVNYWRSLHQWTQPTVSILKSILHECIHGIDIQGESLHLTAFSLALAICDALQPNVIWNELHFDKLSGSNLVEDDFFNFVRQYRERAATEPKEGVPSDQRNNNNSHRHQVFDLIIGNPPFMSELTEAGEAIDAQAKLSRGNLPDNQAAYLVAEQAMELLHQTANGEHRGKLCLIQPSGILYNEKARSFQRYLFSHYKVDYILDFVSTRGLFKSAADTKVVAIIASQQRPDKAHRIVHLTFRRTFSVKEQIGFEIDHYDRHIVFQSQAVTAPFTWKTNLLGGGRLFHLAARLKKMKTIDDFLTAQKWDSGEGFIAGETGARVSAAWLTGKRLLASEQLTEEGIKGRLSTVNAELFAAPRTPHRYEAPIMLIRENERLQCGFWDHGFLAYKAKIVGIRAPRKDKEQLRRFFDDFRNARAVLRAFCLLESTQLLVGKATAILKRDIDNLPWPQEDESWDLSEWEQVLCDDMVEYMADYVRLGQDSPLLAERVGLKKLREYQEFFCSMLGSVYDNLKAGRTDFIDGFVCQAFYFGHEPNLKVSGDLTNSIHELIYAKSGEALRTTRMVRIYSGNVVLIVKPDRLRYWITSLAIQDADDTLADLMLQGY